MTCKEKLIADHPKWTEMDINYRIHHCDCPSVFGYLDDPDYCATDCAKCWNREIPETEETSESDGPRKVCDEHAFELAEKNARIAELEQQNRNQCDLINEKIAEITVCHTRVNELTNNLEESSKIMEEQLKVINKLQKDKYDLESNFEYLTTHHNASLKEKDEEIKNLKDKLTEYTGIKIPEASSSTNTAIALSMFNKYHALLDAGFYNDDALKLIVMWKD